MAGNMTTIHINHTEPSPARAIIREWMDRTVRTLADYDIQGHLGLISKEVKVHGVPEFGIIDYKDWAAQVEHEFKNKLIKSVEFRGDRIRAESPQDIMFLTLEVVTASDGQVIENALEVLLKKEDDGVWRVIQERILDEGESRHFGLNNRSD